MTELRWDKKIYLDTPRTDSSLLKFTRKYGDILACQYPGTDTEKSSIREGEGYPCQME